MNTQITIWGWICLCLFFSGCANLSQNPNQQYPKEKLNQLDNQKWKIEGKISYVHMSDSKRNFVGRFAWQSEKSEFKLNFYNQITNQALLVSGNYSNPPIRLIKDNQNIEFDSLNQVLWQFFDLNLNWQDLVLWLAYQMPKSASRIAFDEANEVVGFDYQNLKVEYLSFFDQEMKNSSSLPVKKVKLINIMKLGQDNKKESQLRISLKNFN